MVPKYVWILFFISTLYMLYSSNQFTQVLKYVESYYNDKLGIFFKRSFKQVVVDNQGGILFTKNTLNKFSNVNDGLYLSILGQVFDVTKGVKHYGPGETYHAFTGRDASAAFITGDFNENGLTDDVSSLTNKQIQSLMNWVEFYRKTYVYKGKLIGRYYHEDGSPTNERAILEEKVQLAKKVDSQEEQIKLQFPPCNIEWNADSGTVVWCTKNSGGITRNWIGVPRMLYENLESKQYRCACVDLNSKEYEENKGIIQAYEGCAADSSTCNFITTN
ncbi:neuferricin [Phymastichus coffea]|uniref:neuferricin n=1 Tax=Phymastichus coffea TaxID=108790 RepID=UPI00273AB427|nr:neuferricin [Phymastichus coffea]